MGVAGVVNIIAPYFIVLKKVLFLLKQYYVTIMIFATVTSTSSH
jgi:hypothetical protein